MAVGHYVRRLMPQLDARWVIAIAVVVGAVVGLRSLGGEGPAPPLDLLALDASGNFGDTVAIPGTWADTGSAAHDIAVRFPLILGIRNEGDDSVTPGRLDLSLPLRYRLAVSGGAPLTAEADPGSPLVTYRLRPRIGAVPPHRMPALIPDTLWLEVLMPAFYCVAVADSIPAFVPAPPRRCPPWPTS